MGTAPPQQELPRIWGIGTCVMEMVWIEMSHIIDVPGWDLFMMERMECSGNHRVYIEPHWLCNEGRCKEPYLLIVCVFVCCLLRAIFIAVSLGISPLRLYALWQ